MKKLQIIAVLLLCLLVGCGSEGTQAVSTTTQTPTDAVSTATMPEVPQEGEFATEVIDDGTRYFFGSFSIDMEYAFVPETVSDGSMCLSNGVIKLLISHTDDYDREVFSAYGYDLAAVRPEEYGSILIDANGLDKDCMFYDSYDNLCLRYSTPASDGAEYQVLAVVKKAPDNSFWLLQFIAGQTVLDAYMVYIPQWASTVTFY